MNCSYFKSFHFFIVWCFTISFVEAQTFQDKIDSSRSAYKEAFVTDERAPLTGDDVHNLRFYAPDSTYRSVANVKFIYDSQPVIIPTYSGKEKKYLRYAELSIIIKGVPVHLTLFKSVTLADDPQYADYLFLPFTDPTNDESTYGGGRYLDLKRSDIKNNEIIVDFNLAYNPYCAYSAGYNCPIPPPENAIGIAIQAGEKKFAGAYKKQKSISK